MNFLVDAHLPRRLAHILQEYGHVSYHTLDLPHQNRTSDDEIMDFADTHDCIVTPKTQILSTPFTSSTDLKSCGFSQPATFPTVNLNCSFAPTLPK